MGFSYEGNDYEVGGVEGGDEDVKIMVIKDGGKDYTLGTLLIATAFLSFFFISGPWEALNDDPIKKSFYLHCPTIYVWHDENQSLLTV